MTMISKDSKALYDIRASRSQAKREITKAQSKIETMQDHIMELMEIIERQEAIVSEYDYIIYLIESEVEEDPEPEEIEEITEEDQEPEEKTAQEEVTNG